MSSDMVRFARLRFLAASLALIITSFARADTNLHVGIFAQQPAMVGAQLSPDGSRVAFLTSVDGRNHLFIEQYKPDFRRHIVKPGDYVDFMWARWANDERIVFAASYSAIRGFNETTETRLFSVSATGTDMQALIKPGKYTEIGSRVPTDLPNPQLQDDVVDWLVDEPDYILVSVDEDQDLAYRVRKVDVRDGDYKNVSPELIDVQNWLTDQSGELRLAWGYHPRTKELAVRQRSLDGEWLEKRSDWWHGGFAPLAFTEDPNIAYVSGRNDAGIEVIRLMNLDTGEFLETVFENDTYDSDGVIVDWYTRKPVGVAYTEHMSTAIYFDPTMAKLQRTIDGALAGNTNRIVTTSKGRRQILVLSHSDINPGSYFLWDRDEKSVSHYSNKYAGIPEDLLSHIKHVNYEARDGLTIHGYLTVPNGKEAENLPTVILPHGGPGARDSMGYDYLGQFIASLGYAVFQPNFRGSTGYGARFQNAGLREWGGKMQDDVTDGAQWLIDQGIADSDRLCIVGWSYGGYAAAMGAVKTPDLYSCAASINGVLNLPRMILDDQEYFMGSEWVENMGLEGESSKAVSPYHQAEEIQVPMLIIQAEDDSRVHKEQGRGMANRLKSLKKPVEYVEIEFGGHSILNVEGREKILQSLGEFLERNL